MVTAQLPGEPYTEVNTSIQNTNVNLMATNEPSEGVNIKKIIQISAM